MKSCFLLALLLLFPMVGFSHEGHGHAGGNPYKDMGIKIEEQQARDFSKNIIHKLVENRKLASTWDDAAFEKAYQKTFKAELEWVVMFTNNRESNRERRNLYIFLSLYGDFLGANFTGD